MFRLFFVVLSVALMACPAPTQTRCEVVDAGTSMMIPDAGNQIPDAGTPIPDAGNPTTEEVVRFVNYTSVSVSFSVADAGVLVEPFSTASWSERKTGHVSLIKRTVSATIEGRQMGASLDVPHEAAPVVEGEVHRYSVVVSAFSQLSTDGIIIGVLIKKGYDSYSSRRDAFTARIAASLGDSASALDAGVDLTGDCLSDVGARVGGPAKIAVFTDDSTTVCAADGVWALKANAAINGDEVDDVSLVADLGQPALAHRLRVWRLMQGVSSTNSLRLSAAVPDIFVLNMRSPGAVADFSLGTLALVSGAQPGRPVQLPPLVAYALKQKTKTKSNNANDRITAGGSAVPLNTDASTGPCRPPYLCDFVVSSARLANNKHPELMRTRSSELLVVSDTEAQLIALPEVDPTPGIIDTPFFLPIVTGSDRASSAVCFGNDIACTSNDAVSYDLPSLSVPMSIAAPVRLLPTLRQGSQARTQVRVRIIGSAGASDVVHFSPPQMWPTTSTILVLGPARVMDANAAADAKVVVQVSNGRKNYVGHVTLIKQ